MVEAVEDVDESMNSVQRKGSLNGFWVLTKLVLQEKNLSILGQTLSCCRQKVSKHPLIKIK